MPESLSDAALAQLFHAARTRNAWTDRSVSERQIRALYDLVRVGPTSANTCPARFVWVRSVEGKARLAALAHPANQIKIQRAPVTAIVGYDLDFAKNLYRLFPSRAEALETSFRDPEFAAITAFATARCKAAT